MRLFILIHIFSNAYSISLLVERLFSIAMIFSFVIKVSEMRRENGA